MHSFRKVGAREAFLMLDHSVKEADKIKKHIAIAVCGPEGELIAFLRMDGASAAASTIAQAKAYTCARDRKSSKEMGDFMRNANRPSPYWADKNITGFGGGIPIVAGGEVIGGIGISGLSEEEDERIAHFAVNAVIGER